MTVPAREPGERRKVWLYAATLLRCPAFLPVLSTLISALQGSRGIFPLNLLPEIFVTEVLGI